MAEPLSANATPANGWKRFAWLALIWVCSVAALGLVAFALRLLMTAAGMKR